MMKHLHQWLPAITGSALENEAGKTRNSLVNSDSKLEFRPIRNAHSGAIVKRIFRNLNSELRNLPDIGRKMGIPMKSAT
jgi:hypothetical protein